MKKYFLIIINIGLAAGLLNAQDAKEDFKKINLSYGNTKFITAGVSYNIYQNETTKAIFKSESGSLRKRDSLTYNKLGPVETIINSNYHLVVDNDEKLIRISKRSAGKTQENYLMLSHLDLVLDACKKIEYKVIDQNSSSYELGFPSGEYKKMEIVFNRETYLLEKMTLFLRRADYLDDDGTGTKEPPRIEIIYNSIDTKSEIALEVFSEKKFLAKNNDDYVPVGVYKDYEVINLLLTLNK